MWLRWLTVSVEAGGRRQEAVQEGWRRRREGEKSFVSSFLKESESFSQLIETLLVQRQVALAMAY